MTLLDDEEREEEREEELRLEDRLTLEEELPPLRDEEETELLREDTDLELERDEREDELRDELRLTADDLDTGAVDLLLLTELAFPLPLLRREEERDEEELELLFLVEELCIVELIDLLKFEEREGVELESRLLLELLSLLILDGYVPEVDLLTCDFTSLEEAVLRRSGEDAAFERDKELFLEG